jgi:dynein heavy chain, axonemal
MYDYYKIFTETKPLREKLVEVRKLVEIKTAELKVKKDALEEVNKKIRSLQAAFDEKIA